MESDFSAYFNKGNALYDLGNYSEAIEEYNRAIEFNTKNSSAYHNKGLALRNLGKYSEAIEEYNKAIKIDPKNYYAYNNKALAFKNLRKYSEAIEEYNKAIEINPKNSKAYVGKGITLYNLGKYSDAIEEYNKAIQIDPKYYNAYNNKGFAFKNLGKYSEAIEEYNKAIEINPKNPYAYNNKGFAFKNLGKYSEAIEEYNTAIEIDPKNSSAYVGKGNALMNLKKYSEATEEYNKAIEIDPNNSSAFHNKGIALNNLEKCSEALNKAIEIDSKSFSDYYNKGNELKFLGKYAEAIEEYSKAIEIDPKYSLAIKNREEAMKKLKEKELIIIQEGYSKIEKSTEEVKKNEKFETNNLIPKDKIEIIKLLGKGGFGKVLLGKYALTDVAVKVIKLDDGIKKELIEQIPKEVCLMANLRHLNLVYFYGLSIDENKIRIVMELCKGKSLFDLLHREGVSISINQKLKILLDIAAGLYYLHSQKKPILHRDIKSLNVLLAEEIKDENSNVTAKITDFGLSTTISESKSRMVMSQCGTLLWTAPEILKEEPYGVKCDIYSFAIVIWEVFAQKLPYSDLKISLVALGNKVCYQNLRPTLSLLHKETPKEVKDLMIQCWDDDDKKRPDLQEVHEILNKLLNK